MKICFGGDVFLGGDLLYYSSKDSININAFEIIDSKIFHNADKRVVNLEQAMSDTSKINEAKSTMTTNAQVVDLLTIMNMNVVCLANNHIHDKNEQGIADTIKILDKNQIGHFGAGNNLAEAERPYWITKNIALLGYCGFGKTYLNQIMVATSAPNGCGGGGGV